VENDFVNKFAGIVPGQQPPMTRDDHRRPNEQIFECSRSENEWERLLLLLSEHQRETSSRCGLTLFDSTPAEASLGVCGHGPSNNNKKAASDNLFSLCPGQPAEENSSARCSNNPQRAQNTKQRLRII